MNTSNIKKNFPKKPEICQKNVFYALSFIWFVREIWWPVWETVRLGLYPGDSWIIQESWHRWSRYKNADWFKTVFVFFILYVISCCSLLPVTYPPRASWHIGPLQRSFGQLFSVCCYFSYFLPWAPPCLFPFLLSISMLSWAFPLSFSLVAPCLLRCDYHYML